MVSPRAVPTTASKGTRTYGNATRARAMSSQDGRTEVKTSASRSANTSHLKGASFKKLPANPESSSAGLHTKVDPYSLSDHDDDLNSTLRKPKPLKRKRPLSSTDRVSTAVTPRSDNKFDSRSKKRADTDRSPSTDNKRRTVARSSTLRATDEKVQISPQSLRNGHSGPMTNIATSPRKQPRLIDALAAQKDTDSDSEVEHGTIKQQTQEGGSRDRDDEIRSLISSNNTLPAEVRSPAKTYTPRMTDVATKSTKIKFTYSQLSRSMAPNSRAQGQLGGAITEEQESDSVASSPLGPGPNAFDMSDVSDTEEDRRLVIKSVHELRRAGANHRFSDELEDLLSRIGRPGPNPSTLRRNALLELSHKLQNKDFASQFRDHADRDNIADSVGQEEDTISGFALAAVLVQFLSDRPAPHLLHKLAAEGIGTLMSRLLRVSDDIDAIASRKQTNLSKHSRLSLAGIKAYIARMDVWHEKSLSALGPRSLALQLLDILYRSSNWDESTMISADCLDDLSFTAGELLQHYDGSQGDADFDLLVSIMESQSNVARAADQEVPWLRRQSSNASRILHRTLRLWPRLPSRTRLAALKMAINATNTCDGASAFDSGNLLSDVGQCISTLLGSAREAVESGGLDDASYESLLLVLGVMINILEHCPAARGSMDTASIESLATLYANNRLAMTEADSEEKSKISVAFGYLAVSLGYLSLSEPGLSVIRSLQDGQGVRKLLGSIRDFINVYKNVESKIHGLEGLVSELQTQML